MTVVFFSFFFTRTIGNHWFGYDMHIFSDFSCQEVFSYKNKTNSYPEYEVLPINNLVACDMASPLVDTYGFIALSCPKKMSDSGPTFMDHMMNWLKPIMPESPDIRRT